MALKTYLWLEDRKGKASYTFWTVLMAELCPDVIVESKKNNSELVKAVRTLADTENRYIIVFDNSFDNVQLYMEQRALEKAASVRDNVFLLHLVCFEYTLLEFDRLIDWIYAPEDDFREKRSSAIAAREKLVEMLHTGEMDYKTIREVVEYDKNLSDHNIEQLSARLLFDLTRNTGWEVSKGKIGDCWIKSCCDWPERQEDDICGLDTTRLAIAEKMQQIYHGTSLQGEFSRIGWEVSL